MSKADQRIFAFGFLAVLAAGAAMKFGRNLPVLGDAADGFGA